METGDIYIIFACFLLLFDFILLLKTKQEEEKKKKREYAFFASAIACVLVVASYFRLTMAFVNNNFRLQEVYTYSSSGLALQYKLGDPWIGSSGSMLFVILTFALLYFVYRFTGLGKESEFRSTTYKIMDLFLISLILVTLLKSPFERLSVTPPDGAGLNPLLQTFWVLVHPPVVFLGYVFVFFAFALMLAGMIIGESDNQELRTTLKRSLCAAWLFLALGIALGGWWSYEVLGWGGYWAWDPVETASLLPWLALTAYFHLPAGSKDLSKEFTLMVTFSLIIFATALTRGGLLESVHAFGESTVGPVLLAFAVCVVLYFFYLAMRADKPLFAFEIDTSSLRSISIFTAYWSLMLLLMVCFLLIALLILNQFISGSPMTMDLEDRLRTYNYFCYPLTLAFVAALMGCNVTLKVKKYVLILITLLGIGVVLTLLRQPTPNPLANFGLPLLLVAGIAIAHKAMRSLQKKKQTSHVLGITLVHLSVIIILLGVFISATAVMESGDIPAKPNSVIDSSGVEMNLNNCTVQLGTGSVYSRAGHAFTLPEYSALKVDVAIKEGGTVHNEIMAMYYYTNYGVVSRPLIISSLTGDIYVFMQPTQNSSNSLRYALMGMEEPPEDFFIRVKRIPLVWLVWLGIIIQGMGMAILLSREFRKI
ncbi:MAG: cytochrome c biogenesis protein CcsA [Halobacteriota archaeon]